MLPSAGRRALAIFGVCCGLLAIFLSDWGLQSPLAGTWKIFSVLCVASLMGIKSMPAKTFDMALLRQKVGDLPVERLMTLQNIGLVLCVLIVPIAVFFPPLLHPDTRRHPLLIALLLAVLLTTGLYVHIEIAFRGLLKRAEMI